MKDKVQILANDKRGLRVSISNKSTSYDKFCLVSYLLYCNIIDTLAILTSNRRKNLFIDSKM